MGEWFLCSHVWFKKIAYELQDLLIYLYISKWACPLSWDVLYEGMSFTSNSWKWKYERNKRISSRWKHTEMSQKTMQIMAQGIQAHKALLVIYDIIKNCRNVYLQLTWKWGLDTLRAICLNKGSITFWNWAGSIASNISSISPRNIT